MAMDSGESFNGELEVEDGNVPLADLLPSFLVKPASIVTVMEKISYISHKVQVLRLIFFNFEVQ